MRPARTFVFFLVAVIAATACQVDADVLLQMREDGSGTLTVTVTLDPEAAARIPDLAEQLQIDDLEAAGWRVEGPSTVEGGALQLRATKAFETPEQGAQVLTELTGDQGIFRDVRLDRSDAFARTTYSFEATADAGRGVVALTDEALAEVIGGEGFGGQLERIEAETGQPADEQVTLTLRVQLPGESRSWAIEPGGAAEQLDVERQELRPVPLALVGGAVLSGLAGIGLLVGRTIAALRRRRRPAEVPARVASDEDVPPGTVRAEEISWADGGHAPGSGAAGAVSDEHPVDAAATRTSEDDASAARRLELVVLDVAGVVFTTGRDTTEHLTTFVRDRGSSLERHAVATTWELAAEGRLTVGELWGSLGLTEDPGDLSDEFLARHRLRAGVRELLERLQSRELPVAGVADDVAEWSRKLRTTHKLDHLTRAWIVSGDVGERLPGGAVLGRVIQVTGIEARNALFISDRAAHLDAARSFGFAGALFVPEGGAAIPAGVAYPVITSLDELSP
jgi:FMN phosphatase YigB (HAD superfamily)